MLYNTTVQVYLVMTQTPMLPYEKLSSSYFLTVSQHNHMRTLLTSYCFIDNASTTRQKAILAHTFDLLFTLTLDTLDYFTLKIIDPY